MDIIAEEWRPVPGAEGRYEVSNLGRVKSLRRVVSCGIRQGKRAYRTVPEKILKLGLDQDGYAQVLIAQAEGDKFKNTKIHQLVALVFLGPKPKGEWVLHGPNGKKDNSVGNLYYGTPAQNVQDKWRDGTIIIGEKHHKAKLKEADVIEIRELHKQGLTQKEIAARYSVGDTAITKIINRENWKWL
jgi:hypothetical protein